MLNQIVRKGSFDAGHRVMFQRFKCSHLHGHRYDYELVFAYSEMQELGYAIDFSELKRIGGGWIDQAFDHTFIANPLDREVIELCEKLGSRCYRMHLLDAQGSCNPTVENIAKEVFFAVQLLLETDTVKLERVSLHETASCVGVCLGLTSHEVKTLKADSGFMSQILEFKSKLGQVEYDSRKV